MEYRFLRVQHTECHHEYLIAFSCKKTRLLLQLQRQTHDRRLHGCRRQGEAGARTESTALLVDEILPEHPIGQWVMNFPFQLRFLFTRKTNQPRSDTDSAILPRWRKSPEYFIARLASLVPRPRANLTRDDYPFKNRFNRYKRLLNSQPNHCSGHHRTQYCRYFPSVHRLPVSHHHHLG